MKLLTKAFLISMSLLVFLPAFASSRTEYKRIFGENNRGYNNQQIGPLPSNRSSDIDKLTPRHRSILNRKKINPQSGGGLVDGGYRPDQFDKLFLKYLHILGSDSPLNHHFLDGLSDEDLETLFRYHELMERIKNKASEFK